ncbi:hypothetical protein L1887_35255 [Cichorium endivia]|nr:hypothetical protein L1887_35255 [Cichorium endivia]
MEEEPHKIEDAESKSKKSTSKSVKITRVRKPSERIMNRTSFSKFTNEASDPIILDFDSELSKPILASPSPQKPNTTDPTGTIEISDTPTTVQYERRTKHKNESRGSRVAEHQRRGVNEKLDFPKKRSIVDENTSKDVPPKLRRVQPRRSSITPEVPVSKPELQKQTRKNSNIKPVTKKKTLKQNIPAPIPPQSQSDNILIRTSPKPLFETLHSLSNPQKQYMCEIGLRDLLDITVDGDRNILDSSSKDGGDDTIDKWKEQFKLENDIRPKGLRFDGVDVEKGRPSICCWNASTMRLREELEMASGQFGMGVIHDIVGREETQQGLVTSINDMLVDFEYMRNKIQDKLSVAIGKFPDDPTFTTLKKKFKTLSHHLSSDSEAEYNDEFQDTEAGCSPNNDAAQKVENTDGTVLSQWWTEPETLQEIDQTLALVTSSHKSFENTPLNAFSLGLTQEFEETIKENVRKISGHTITTPIPCPVPISSSPLLTDAPLGNERIKRNVSIPDTSRSPDVVFSGRENPTMTEATRKELFLNHLLQCIQDYDASLRSIPLVLLPVVRSNHIFLFAIDLNSPSFLIIDNLACEATISDRYGDLPTIVIIQEVAQYQKIPAKRRDEIKFEAARNIQKRLSQFS